MTLDIVHHLQSEFFHNKICLTLGIARNFGFLWQLIAMLTKPFTKSLQQGAATTIFCAVSDDLRNVRFEPFRMNSFIFPHHYLFFFWLWTKSAFRIVVIFFKTAKWPIKILHNFWCQMKNCKICCGIKLWIS